MESNILHKTESTDVYGDGMGDKVMIRSTTVYCFIFVLLYETLYV